MSLSRAMLGKTGMNLLVFGLIAQNPVILGLTEVSLQAFGLIGLSRATHGVTHNV